MSPRTIDPMNQGSSPRMRGAPQRIPDRLDGHGIIPADAGSTGKALAPEGASRDHPRGCGEHGHLAYDAARQMGSSPRMRGAHGDDVLHGPFRGIIPADAGSTRGRRMRGAHGDDVLHGPFRGIIPADAGSTPRCSSTARRSRDHPRGCGEHGEAHAELYLVRGSSPRMRGAQGRRRGDP